VRTSYTITGQVIDFTSGTPVPGATISLADNFGYEFSHIGQTDAQGNFAERISETEIEATDFVTFTSAGYRGAAVPIERMVPNVRVQLQRNVVDLPPVVVTTRKNKWLPWLLLLGLVLVAKQKK